ENPLHAGAYTTLARLFGCLRQPDQAIAHLREALALQPGIPLLHDGFALSFLQKKMPAEAIAEFEIAARIGTASEKAYLVYGYASCGRRADALRTLAELLES